MAKKKNGYILLVVLLIFLSNSNCCSVSTSTNFQVWGTFNPITNTDLERKLVPEHFKFIPHEIVKESSILKKYKNKKFIVFIPDYLEKIYTDTIPKEKEIGHEVLINTSLGEYEPFTFAIHAMEDLEIVKIKIENFKKDETIFSHKNFDIRVMRHLYKSLRAEPEKSSWVNWENPAYSFLPVLLEKRDSIKIRRNETKQFWGTFYSPSNSIPGLYESKIKIMFNSGEEAIITLKIRIYTFQLIVPNITYGLFYSLSKGDLNYPENLKKEFIDIREHGINALALMSVPPLLQKDEKMIFDFSEDMGSQQVGLKQLVNAYIETGFTRPVNYTFMTNRLIRGAGKGWKEYKLYSTEFDSCFKKLVIEIMNKSKEDWPSFLFGFDELSGKKERKIAKYYLELLKDIPGVVTIAELNGLTYAFNDAEYFKPLVDIECFHRRINNFSYIIKRSADEKKPVCIYNTASMGIEPVIERYAFGFDVWRLGATEVWQWNYHQGNDFGWKDKNGKWHNREDELGIKRTYMAFAYGYPAPNGPVPSIAWEALREGIDDAKYIYTLKKYIKEAILSSNPKALQEANNAQMVLDDIYKDLPLEFKDREEFIEHLYIGKLDELRRTIAEKIELLKEILGPIPDRADGK